MRSLLAVAIGSAVALAAASAAAQVPSGAARAAAPAPGPSSGTPPAAGTQTTVETISDALFEPATPGGLTADEVARKARATSYNAAAQNQALVAAQARLDEAIVAYFPKLSLTASYTRLSPITLPAIGSVTIDTPVGPQAINTGFSYPILLDNTLLQAALVVPLSDYLLRTSQSYAAASHSTKAASLDESAARLNSGLDGRIAYYTWLRARAQLSVAERNVQVNQAHVTDAKNAFEVGTASRADVLSAEAQMARAELVREQERNASRAAEDQMRIAMHDTSSRPFSIGEDLRGGVELSDVQARDIESLRAEALDKRLEIRALDETAWSLREQTKAAKAALYPRIDGIGDVVVSNPNQRYFPPQNAFNTTWDLGVRLTWAPNDTFAAIHGVTEARARAQQTEMQKASLMDSVKTEVLQAHQALAEATVAVQTTARALAATEESYRVRRELFRNGRATSVELQDAEAALFQSGFESVNAHANLKIARARLLHAIGRDVPEVSASQP